MKYVIVARQGSRFTATAFESVAPTLDLQTVELEAKINAIVIQGFVITQILEVR